jgi:hypothetical protein
MPTLRPPARTIALGLGGGAAALGATLALAGGPALPGLVLIGAGMAAALALAPRGGETGDSGGATEDGGGE